MKIASSVLGIVGGVLTILLAVVFLLMGVLHTPIREFVEQDLVEFVNDADWDDVKVIVDGETVVDTDFDWDRTHGLRRGVYVFGLNILQGVFWVIAALLLTGGIVGLIGGAIARRNSTAGGAMMLVAAFLGFCCFPFFLTGGILALVSTKQEEQQAAA